MDIARWPSGFFNLMVTEMMATESTEEHGKNQYPFTAFAPTPAPLCPLFGYIGITQRA
jgi:hypothetical protein